MARVDPLVEYTETVGAAVRLKSIRDLCDEVAAVVVQVVESIPVLFAHAGVIKRRVQLQVHESLNVLLVRHGAAYWCGHGEMESLNHAKQKEDMPNKTCMGHSFRSPQLHLRVARER